MLTQEKQLSHFVRIDVVLDDGTFQSITETITNFRYEESIEKDNLVLFDVITPYSNLFQVNENIKLGAKIRFVFGYTAGATSPVHTGRITDIEHDFSGVNINMKVRALDLGNAMKKVNSSYVYENKTSSDIAIEIADRYGLNPVVDPTDKVWESMPQGNIDDLNFLRKLADLETAGNYIVFIRDDELHFVRRGLDTRSLFHYKYGQGNNGILRFTPRWRESTASPGAGTSVTAASFNPETGKFEGAEDSGENDNIATDEFKLLWSGDGDFLGGQNENESINASIDELLADGFEEGESQFGNLEDTGIGDMVKTGKKMLTGANIKERAASIQRAATFKVLEADLKLVGNPSIKVNAVITLSRTLPEYDGNWFVKEATHEFNGTEYTTKLKMSRNGSKKPVKEGVTPAEIINKTVGKEQGEEDEIILLQFDENGTRTADITRSNKYVPPEPI